MTPDAILFLLIFATVGAIMIRAGVRQIDADKPEVRELPPVYIAGPFAPWGGLSSVENVRRAELVANQYRALGHEVVCVHSGILAGEYGDDTNPAERRIGQERTLAECVDVAERGGILAVIQLPSSHYSDGTISEIRKFVGVRPSPGSLHVWRWDEVANVPVRVRV